MKLPQVGKFVVLLCLGFVVGLAAAAAAAAEQQDLDEDFDFDLSKFGEGLYKGKFQKQLPETVVVDAEVNPEELGNFVEGDIYQPLMLKSGIKFKNKRWKNGIVPYEISEEFNKTEVIKIKKAFVTFKQKSCVRFVPREPQHEDYVFIQGSGNGCWSTVGRAGGKQILNVNSSSCLLRPGTILHELMHVLGFFHEHNRYDRDNYINVYTQNVKDEALSNFKKDFQNRTTTFGIAYDLGSVMHYSTMAFSKNGNPTIEPKVPYKGQIGQRNGFSMKDIKSLNKMYCETYSIIYYSHPLRNQHFKNANPFSNRCNPEADGRRQSNQPV